MDTNIGKVARIAAGPLFGLFWQVISNRLLFNPTVARLQVPQNFPPAMTSDPVRLARVSGSAHHLIE